MVAPRGDQDHAHRLVATRLVDRIDARRDHVVGERIALVGTIEGDAQHTVVEQHVEAVDALISRVVAHLRENSALIAVSAPSRSVAPPGTSGRRTPPCSRLGSRMVA